ncbi:hypothetical protein P3T37_007301 [Kitasatospora sp. MAA4]|uniref:hypothetical protein n=1 Tax=Kitasatospora sp. MAA4 TaxID=3035093 RepID=UPI002474EB73|nr:hypothetical protein [Kitasatospora sp. MAA4]MDH6137866.1 hypothetical protein [Kitasatospora sp. MAA4]
MPGSTRPFITVRPVRHAVIAVIGALAALVAASGCGSSSSTHATSATAPSAAAATTSAATPATPATPAPTAAGSSAAAQPGSAAPAQLSAAQLPDGGVEGWKPLAAARTQAVTTGIELNECASVLGAASWQQQAYVSVFHTPAEQDVFTFPSATAAQSAYRDLQARMGSCQVQSRALQAKAHLATDAQVATTAATGAGTAWSRQWTGVEGVSAAGPQTNHLYAVQQGASLAVVHFDEWAGTQAAAYDTRADQGVLTAIAQQLA